MDLNGFLLLDLVLVWFPHCVIPLIQNKVSKSFAIPWAASKMHIRHFHVNSASEDVTEHFCFPQNGMIQSKRWCIFKYALKPKEIRFGSSLCLLCPAETLLLREDDDLVEKCILECETWNGLDQKLHLERVLNSGSSSSIISAQSAKNIPNSPDTQHAIMCLPHSIVRQILKCHEQFLMMTPLGTY